MGLLEGVVGKPVGVKIPPLAPWQFSLLTHSRVNRMAPAGLDLMPVCPVDFMMAVGSALVIRFDMPVPML
jgi:hypothetical protein